jgi:hypothetical protein
MTLVRLDVRFDVLDALVDELKARHLIVSISDADPIVALGSLHDRVTNPLGVWLELSDDYSAQMAARDVATLSWLVPLDTVIVSSTNAESNAQVVEALLTDDEVNFSNDVATIVGAYNRSAPPRPITVWSWDGTVLRHGNEVLRMVSSESSELGVTTRYR